MRDIQRRAEMEQQWEEIEGSAIASKNPVEGTCELIAYYKNLGNEERRIANMIIAEWIGSIDLGKRFDALALVAEFAIVEVLPQLRAFEAECKRRLVKRRCASDDPAAPYDYEKVQSLIEGLETTMRMRK